MVSSTKPKVYIIVLNWNSLEYTLRCLASLRKLHYSNYDIVVVDNGSRNFSKTEIQRTYPDVKVFLNPTNLGYTGGNNVGIKYALEQGADYILLLNNDTTIAPDFLDILIKAGENYESVGILGPTIFYQKRPDEVCSMGGKIDLKTGEISVYENGKIDKDGHMENIEVDFISGCSLLLKKSILETIGPLEEKFFAYWEDVEYCIRAKQIGVKSLIVPKAKVWHEVSTSIGEDSALKAYYKTRNYLLIMKFYGSRHKRFSIRFTLKIFKDIMWLLFKSKDRESFKKAKALIWGIADFYLNKYGEGSQWLSN